ncbi:mechanosensitive ion channel family protein [Corynebacterium tuscaniense]|uniref:mechanosensitive ion channel family protein n=1 Tax=Corynebacterium tuscaniense TaxID=302449 RepID=UPI00050FF117|nr:mechanosensitive ion channel family protein [Corynebacterium tuscaniense]KGF22507.1 hypothetical protein HMPREF2129_07440 [Corynebacterium tuscaniense DNF00037]
MPFSLILDQVWRWLADTGINLALLLVLAFLVPRAGRLANRYVERQVAESKDTNEGKTSLALAGVGIYIVQLVAYFLILVFFLQQLGFSLAGAAIPATVVSAAIGFGSQQIIADFVAGFFILTEKQYGVGDLVTFKGNGIDVTGDVIQITMRATQVRTLEQYTVTIPNSAAQVCINNSNHWSRALVEVPVPLLGSHDTEEVISRAEAAARRAISEPDIVPLIQGDLLCQPGTDLNPPNTVGMPWTLDIRFMVRCSPGDQFPIERAIRVYILDEFFDEYGSAAAMPEAPLFDAKDTRTTAFTPAFLTRRYASEWNQWEAEDKEESDKEHKPILSPTPETQVEAEEAAPTETQRTGLSAGTPTKTDNTAPEDDPATKDKAQAEKERRYTFGTLGGRIRASTGILILVFAVLLILRGLTLSSGEDSEKNSGILAPPRNPEPSSIVETPQPQTQTTQAPAQTMHATPTATVESAPNSTVPTSEPTDVPTSNPQQPRQNTPEQDEPAQQQGAGPTQESSISEPARP